MITAISSVQQSAPQLRAQAIQKQSFKAADLNDKIELQGSKANTSFKGRGFKVFLSSILISLGIDVAAAAANLTHLMNINPTHALYSNAFIIAAGAFLGFVSKRP